MSREEIQTRFRAIDEQTPIKVKLGVLIFALGLFATAVLAWGALKWQVSDLAALAADCVARQDKLEASFSAQSGTLQRIDERTANMQRLLDQRAGTSANRVMTQGP
jgi:hypothetical protein